MTAETPISSLSVSFCSSSSFSCICFSIDGFLSLFHFFLLSVSSFSFFFSADCSSQNALNNLSSVLGTNLPSSRPIPASSFSSTGLRPGGGKPELIGLNPPSFLVCSFLRLSYDFVLEKHLKVRFPFSFQSVKCFFFFLDFHSVIQFYKRFLQVI